MLRLCGLHFLIIASYTMARAARDVMFLDTLTSKGLPYLYVGVAVWTALVSSAYGRLGLRQQVHHMLAQLLVICGLALVVFGVVAQHFHGPVPSVVFYLWTGAYGLILISLFWVLANESTDPREADVGSILAFGAMATAAEAHVGPAGHGHGFMDGLLHPLTGLDHILAMIAVGAFNCLNSDAEDIRGSRISAGQHTGAENNRVAAESWGHAVVHAQRRNDYPVGFCDCCQR